MHKKSALFFILICIFVLAGCSLQKNTKAGNDAEAPASYTLKAPASGRVIGMIAEKGERISKGQPLFAISDTKIDQQVKEVQTQLAKAEAELKRMEQGNVNAAPAGNLAAAQANVAAAQQKAAKMNSLLAQGAISRNQAQAAQNELAQATAQLQAAAQLVVSSQPASNEAKAAQQKLIDQLKMQLAKALSAQQANEAVSPCTGRIIKIKVKNNDTVSKDQEIIVLKEEK